MKPKLNFSAVIQSATVCLAETSHWDCQNVLAHLHPLITCIKWKGTTEEKGTINGAKYSLVENLLQSEFNELRLEYQIKEWGKGLIGVTLGFGGGWN